MQLVSTQKSQIVNVNTILGAVRSDEYIDLTTMYVVFFCVSVVTTTVRLHRFYSKVSFLIGK